MEMLQIIIELQSPRMPSIVRYSIVRYSIVRYSVRATTAPLRLQVRSHPPPAVTQARALLLPA
jgi:hypothetical protein